MSGGFVPRSHQTLTIAHTFETGHRLPHLPGKCQSLHGHSWRVEAEVSGYTHPVTGILVEFGAFKAALRGWVDSRLDHGLMLGKDDPLAGHLADQGKVFVFGHDEPSLGLEWPTVENVAHLLGRVVADLLTDIDPDVRLHRVTIHETAVNEATWSPR